MGGCGKGACRRRRLCALLMGTVCFRKLEETGVVFERSQCRAGALWRVGLEGGLLEKIGLDLCG